MKNSLTSITFSDIVRSQFDRRKEVNSMGARNQGKTYKRLSMNLTRELDQAVIELRKQEKYARCSYLELIRVLMAEGARCLGVYPSASGGKS